MKTNVNILLKGPCSIFFCEMQFLQNRHNVILQDHFDFSQHFYCLKQKTDHNHNLFFNKI